MALSNQVLESLKDAESSLRNALAFAARNESPMVNTAIASMIGDIDRIIKFDKLLDKFDDSKFQS